MEYGEVVVEDEDNYNSVEDSEDQGELVEQF